MLLPLFPDHSVASPPPPAGCEFPRSTSPTLYRKGLSLGIGYMGVTDAGQHAQIDQFAG